ncbi:MAG: hypothetical protein H6709_04720 [Kofleriaceae bacterium]|nr:hypothetical protein [Kofleriaceae bacterium]
MAALGIELGMARLIVFSALQTLRVSPMDVSMTDLDQIHEVIDQRLAALGVSEERRSAALARLCVLSVRRAQVLDVDTARVKKLDPDDL